MSNLTKHDALYSLKGKRVWVAGHRGMVGSAIVRRLEGEGCETLTASRSELDLLDQGRVATWVADRKPNAIFLAAAKVGGIFANNTYPAQFLYENLVIETNIVEAARRAAVEKLLFLGSSCIYPKFAPQPIKEDALLTGPLEPTNEWYAIAKIAGLKLAEAYRKQHDCDFISGMPTNLYGPGDNFDLETSHVLPALLRKAHEAKVSGARSFQVWGTGTPRRELMHVDDCADALVFLMKNYSGAQHVNVGTGEDETIRELAEAAAAAAGFDGEIAFDATKPDGTPRKVLDISKLKGLGWSPRIALRDGIRSTYQWFVANVA